ncbi:MAG: LamG-like jellyroll fold domain-containing protein [Planctomycetota bacterium]|nr:LamG-like jellyroll fold domain-containing protein [Planctomycetota bacterium]
MLTLLIPLISCALLHDDPDALVAYTLQASDVDGNSLHAQLGPTIELNRALEFAPDDQGGGAELIEQDRLVIATDYRTVKELLPKKEMTVSAWMSIAQPRQWGGVLGCVQDNNDAETGWVLGYDNRVFTFGLSTVGADDGNGMMTYVKGRTPYEEGKLYHVVATYDGETVRLYVNGKLDAESQVQSGDVLYPEKAPFTLGAYHDDNEYQQHIGRLMDVRLYDLAAGNDWVSHQFDHHADRANLPARIPPERPISEELDWQVPPFLQYATGDSIRIVFETTRPVTGVIRYGETGDFDRDARIEKPLMLGEVVLKGLEPDEPYFYQVALQDDRGQTLETDVMTFQTAAPRGTPVAFAILSDTQDNPTVSAQLSEHIWEQRPGFLVHPGDLTGTGSRKGDWTEEFFPGMNGLLGRVTMYPVLGNHEQDARHYYKYMSLPEPEYYYSFSQGDADFFMIDTNRNVAPGSEQYMWLDGALANSDAKWKFVVHHHPPYSSDENDYGNTWKGRSTRGDVRARKLTTLYDKYDVDLVLNGHIHSYERTWPVTGGRVVDDGGVIYTITGGGGGGLETPGPSRPDFNNTVRRGHHYCMVRVNGDTLEFFAYDLDNRLFDHMRIDKRRPMIQ